MPDESLEQKVDRFLNVYRKAGQAFMNLGPDSDLAAHKALWHEVCELQVEIFERLIENPGALIHYDDPSRIKEAQEAMDRIWGEVSGEQLVEDLSKGAYKDLSFNLTASYLENAKQLKPLFVAVRPSKEIERYFAEAMEAWIHGRYSATLILCWSVLENLIKERVSSERAVLRLGQYKNFRDLEEKTCKEWINSAESSGLLRPEDAQNARKIKKLREQAVHKLQPIESDQAHDAILKTKSIIERLLTPVSAPLAKQPRRT